METSPQIKHSQEFTGFVHEGTKQKYYIGIGNPYAKILFIGKESAIENEDIRIQEYSKNANDWMGLIENNKGQVLSYAVSKDHDLRAGWGRNTWSKYQKLTDMIFERESKHFHVDFLERVFTTEINNSPSKQTASADKSSLKDRKKLFENSGFIQSFPVVVLACSNYITNIDPNREIDKTFKVTYAGDETGKYTDYKGGNWFYLHYSEDFKKLVIHTRQLSMNVDNKMLEDMGKVIRDHLIRNNLY